MNDPAIRSSARSGGLDMVRSAAVLLVLCSHCGAFFADWFGGQWPLLLAISGFFGVELFFVLSGYLIGRLLLRIIARPAGIRDWWVFMVRRWMRTIPLYLLCLIALSVLWPPHFWEPGRARLWHALPWYATLTQNLAWPMKEDWFGVSWSLSVEEWFYLLFSALLIAGAARVGRGWFWVTAGLFLILPPLLRWNLPPGTNWGEVTEKVVIYRLDSIVFGVLLSALEARGLPPARWRAPMFVAGVSLVAFVWGDGLVRVLGWSGHMKETFLFDAVSFGYALMLPAAAALTRAPWGLRRAAAAISLQSYCLYLIHLTVLEMVGFYRPRFHWSAPVSVAIVLALISGVSWASYRWFEQPILNRRPDQRDDQTA
jgi:peptidoglycan/LPS O-acetylase OafA/YrhL